MAMLRFMDDNVDDNMEDNIIIIIIIIIMFIQTIQCSLTNIVSYTKKEKVLVHYNDEEMSNGGRIFTAS